MQKKEKKKKKKEKSKMWRREGAREGCVTDALASHPPRDLYSAAGGAEQPGDSLNSPNHVKNQKWKKKDKYNTLTLMDGFHLF